MALSQDGQSVDRKFVTSTLASREPPVTKSDLLPAISLPKGGGAIRGIGEKFSTNPVTGTGSMTVLKYRPRIEGLFSCIERWTNIQTGEIHWCSIALNRGMETSQKVKLLV